LGRTERWKIALSMKFVRWRPREHPIYMACFRADCGTRITFWTLGSVLCAGCAVWCVAQMVRAGSMSLGLLVLTLFWGLATARAVEYLLAARRGDAHVGHRH